MNDLTDFTDFTITIDDADLAPAAAKLLATIDPARLMQIAGKAAEVTLRRHFLQLDRRPNKRGWPSRHLWRDIARETALTSATATSATVSISHPAFLAKIDGGTSVPGPGKQFLAIPATAAAYAAGSPREGGAPSNLKVDRQINPATGRMQWALSVEIDGASTVWYFLARKAETPADPDTMPPLLKAEILNAINAFVLRQSGVTP